MHSRFAALLLGLGILDLAYINWALGPDVLASAQARTLEGAGAPASATLAAPPEQAVPAPAASASVPVSPDVSAGAQPTSPEPARVEAARAPEPARVEAVRAPEPAAVEEPARAEAPSEWILHFTLANTAALPEAAEPLVTEIGRRVRSSPHLRVSIIGHADERGTREHNFELGERRARAVADALIGAGVSPEQLYVESRGEEAPRAVGASEQSWAENRRVEIAIYTQRSQTP